ncbi:polymorphic toxin-type HINT domain-containing protein [Herbidospora sp. NBRC 101105]|uniref:polymorphic toxin-type HINT domain-containing protein n=1 Tax=Herbidospora sp. NBRC 101105 TaxID=3032195 RepID=UPI0024A25CAC|nr:polymorphic toxin-type HINT domain-containing protein [Herbidospora sp. NBRC 101105]GLX99506.1 hypothetical protein Hesp01_74560 [Herbidospora sp. NBRC 101105]
MNLRWTARVAAPLAAVLVAGLLQAPPATATSAAPEPIKTKDTPSVDGAEFKVRPAAPDPEKGAAWQPKPITGTVKVEGAAQPISLADTARALVRASGRGEVSLGYEAVEDAYGADWASRLRLVKLPDCAATTPQAAQCQVETPVPAENDTEAKTVSAENLTAGVYALTAGPSGASGDYSATSLSPSATWTAGGSTGDFTWTYPMRTPPGLGGPMPQVALTYSSSKVDGLTASTNNQPSVVGEGWDLQSGGFIERRYRSCADDGVTPKTGDLCWAYDNATVTLAGKASELIRDDASGEWRMKSDDGTKVEKLTGTTNGDNDGEHWKLTTIDGTQYFFGLNRLPGWTSGKPETASAWTVPVYGDDSGEPCNAQDWCRQAWRWNLDYVVDPNGNAATYWYSKETNNYNRNLSTVTAYDRGGWLDRVDYAQRSGTLFTAQAPARVVFGMAERCLPDGNFDCAESKFTTANATKWPDTPADLNCPSTCTGKTSPSFWTRKRLTSVTTQMYSGSGTDYVDVDTWKLTHLFPAAGDGTTPSLWLDSVQQTGKAPGATAVTLAAITFGGAQMHNRVDDQGGVRPFTKRRLASIVNETGGQTSVTYSGEDCTPGSLPAPDSNTRRCFPQYWTPEGETDPIRDWFHKYVVTGVSEVDNTGGAPFVTTKYEYVGGAAWHYDDDDGLTKDKYKTWSQWRGYEKVRVYGGESTETRSMSETLYFRGMDGDKTSSGTRNVSVTDSEGVAVEDKPWLQGTVRESITYSGPGGDVVEGVITDPWSRGPTATRARSFGTVHAYVTGTAKTRTRTALSAGGWRRTESRTAFTDEGLPSEVSDLGDTSTAADDRCTRTTYVRDDTKWIIDTPSRVETVSVACATTPSRPGQLISDAKTTYDTRGNVTKTERLSGWSGGPQYTTVATTVYDAYGRATEVADSASNKTTTAYTHATGGLVSRTTVTNPAGHVTTTDLNPAWGTVTATVDANNKRTDVAYDALGRTTQVWPPIRPKSTNPNSPSVKYTYLVRADGPVAVTTQTIRNDATYTTSHALYDGLLRPRQTQAPAPGGGRVITDTFYNSRGLAVKANASYFNDQAPATTLWNVANDTDIPSQTRTTYDGLGRVTKSAFHVRNVEKWKTTTTYGGDHVTVTPPAGGTPTTTYTDARGLTTELHQHKSVGYDRTRYGYTPAGQLAAVTDAAGNEWKYTYDLRGRKTKDEDPDKGTTTSTYNDLDQLTSTTDARGTTLTYTYDALGRKTGLFNGSTKLADWTYDTLLKGAQTAATRYVGGQPYVTKVDSYDDAYRPITQSVVIPSAEGTKLAGTYQYAFGYNVDGTTAQYTIPAAGGLPRELLLRGYDELGNPLTTSGMTSYVTETRYDKLSQPQFIRMRTSTTAKQTVRQWFYEEGTNRLQRLTTQREVSPAMVSDLNYSYDAAGNITAITDKASTTDAQCFQYDYLRRLTEAWAQGSEGCAATPAQSVVGGPAPYWTSFGYDVTGNRTTEVKHAASGDTTRTYSYPSAGSPRPHGVTAISGGDAYTYDAAGNTVTRKVGADPQQTLDWDAEGHLSKVTTTAGVTSYLYDADGNRLIRRDPTGTTLYLPDQEIRLTTATNSTTCTRFYTHGGQTVAQRVLGTVTWLAGDMQGTATASVTATDAQTTAVRRQTPFGTSRDATTVVWANEKGFVGGTADPSTSLTHLGAREYDPRAGRFLSVDPLLNTSDPQQMNGYSYAANSPVTFSDPTGLIPDDYANGRNGGYRGWQQDTADRKAGRPVTSRPDYKPIGNYTARPAAKAGCGTWDFGCKARSVISSAGQWIAEHKTVIISTAVSIGVGALCTTITAGAGAVGCAVLGGMAGRLVSDGMSGQIDSLGDALTSAAWGAGEGLLGLGIGKLIGAGAGKIGAAFRQSPVRAAPAAPTPRAATSCTTNSFTPATLVLLTGGATKSISDIQLGDEVLAGDTATGKVEGKPVTALVTGAGSKDLVDITVDGGQTITATAGHPFWAPALKKWVPAENLTAGTLLLTAAGTHLQVAKVAERAAVQRVHNLTVADLHTYFVLAGSSPVLVHNCGDAIDLYHGTSREGAAAIRANGVDPAYAPRPRDFGDGFYTTRLRSQAQDWVDKRYPGGEVLHFRVPTSELEGLTTLTFSGPSPLLSEFVRHYRGGGTNLPYDMVEGPMLANPKAFMGGAAPIWIGNQVTFFRNTGPMLDRALQ